jgi:hypothetical protein
MLGQQLDRLAALGRVARQHPLLEGLGAAVFRRRWQAHTGKELN